MVAGESVSSSASTSGSGGIVHPRELQKARKDDESAASAFKAFTGSAHRIDGKALPTKVPDDAKVAKEAMAAKRLAALGGIGGVGTLSETKSEPVQHQSKLGDKFSKKKTSVSAFTGSGQKLG